MSPVKKTARKTSKKPAPKAAAEKPRPRPAAKKAAPAKAVSKKKAATPAPKKAAAAPAAATKKAPGAKAAATKVAATKAAAPAPAAPAAKAGGRPAPGARPPSRPAPVRKPAARARGRAPIAPDFVKPGLGGRWECFRCSSKFYDLEKPDPICPKCGADQREKPRDKPNPPAAPAEKPRRAAVPMGSLLDEEEPVEEFEAEEGTLVGLDAEAFLTDSPDEEEEEVEPTPVDEE